MAGPPERDKTIQRIITEQRDIAPEIAELLLEGCRTNIPVLHVSTRPSIAQVFIDSAVKKGRELRDVLDEKDEAGLSPLVYAIMRQDIVMVNWLIDKGCSLENVDGNGRNALWWSTWGGNLRIFKAIMSAFYGKRRAMSE